MRLPTLHHPPRLLCIGGLLLLAAAEGRFHAKPLTEPLARPARQGAERATPRGEPGGDPANRQDPDEPERVPLALVSTLPDLAPVRWAPSAAELTEADPQALALAWAADAGRPGDDHLPPAVLHGAVSRAARPPLAALSPIYESGYLPHLTLHATICRTGPPRA